MMNQAFYSSQESLYSNPSHRPLVARTTTNFMAGHPPYSSSTTAAGGTEDCPMVEEEQRICVVGEACRNAELLDILMNHFHFVVLRSEHENKEANKYCNKPGNENLPFVMSDFNSADFNDLYSSGKLVAGATLVHQCAATHRPFPQLKPNRPTYCLSMLGMRFCVGGYSTEETRHIVNLVHFMGGSARRKEGDYLIAKAVTSRLYKNFINSPHPVLTIGWIEECWARRSQMQFDAREDGALMTHYALRCFVGLRLYFASSYPSSEAEQRELDEMAESAKANGAELVMNYDAASHIVYARELSSMSRGNLFQLQLPMAGCSSVERPNDPPSSSGSSTPSHHVTKEWFWTSVHTGKCQNEEEFPALPSSTPAPTHHHHSSLTGDSRLLQSRENYPQGHLGISRKRAAGSCTPQSPLTPDREKGNFLPFYSKSAPHNNNRRNSRSRGKTPSSPSQHGSKASLLDNLENSCAGAANSTNMSNAQLPEHLFSSDNLDYGCGGSTDGVGGGGGAGSNWTPTTRRENDKRYQVCEEMLGTEENYIKTLNMVINNFKQPLEERLLQQNQPGAQPALLSQQEISTIFSKLPAIIHVHTTILGVLRRLVRREWNPAQLIGKVWADGASDLEKVYPPYINCYDEAMRVLDSCDAHRPHFHTFIKMAESAAECQRMTLKDMLIKPVQRIPSVLLLLTTLLKRTGERNADHPWVKGAIELIKRVLERANESRRLTEDLQRVMERFNDFEDLPAQIISSDRQFLQSIEMVVLDAGGELRKYRGRSIALFLLNDIIIIAKVRSLASAINNGGGGNPALCNALNKSFLNESAISLHHQPAQLHNTSGYGLGRAQPWGSSHQRGGGLAYSSTPVGTPTRGLAGGGAHNNQHRLSVASLTSTLPRQITLSTFPSLIRRPSPKHSTNQYLKSTRKERRPYRHIVNLLFSGVRSVQVVRSHGLFMVELRGNDADELCFLQMPRNHSVEAGIEFFDALIQKICTSSSRQLTLEELSIDELRLQAAQRPEDFKAVLKHLDYFGYGPHAGPSALASLMEDSFYGEEVYDGGMGATSRADSSMLSRRPSQLRRAVSQVSLGLQRFTSRTILPYIKEGRRN